MEKLSLLLILIGFVGTNGITIILPTADDFPTFVTTSSPDLTDSTPVTVHNTQDTSKPPVINSGSEGAIAFPDEDNTHNPDSRPIPTIPSWPIPIPTNLTPTPTEATPEPTPAPITRPTPEPTLPVTPNDDLVAEKETLGTNRNFVNPFEAIEQCIRSCKMTSEYSPVCGTDGRTYTNIGQLYCAKKCGIYVDLQVRGPCDSSTAAPTTSLPLEPTTQSAAVRQCIRNCRVTSEYNPVCGSDGATYNNPGRLMCARDCGVVVDMRARGPCAATPTPPPTMPPTEATTLAGDVMQCIVRNCPSTQEFNPVCGSDGITYFNPRRLYCARRCGVNVSFKSTGFCFSSSATSSTAATLSTEPVREPEIPTTTESDLVKECSRSCPTSTEYSPVCGSNGATYMNYGQLICAHICGVDVVLRGKGPCPGENTPPTVATTIATSPSYDDVRCIADCPVPPQYSPVCGSNRVTYQNIGHLYCAQSCGVDVELGQNGRCVDSSNGGGDVEADPSTSPRFRACMYSCPTATKEFNPVCGSNDVTYNNLSQLQCAASCGLNVSLLRNSKCPKDLQRPRGK